MLRAHNSSDSRSTLVEVVNSSPGCINEHLPMAAVAWYQARLFVVVEGVVRFYSQNEDAWAGLKRKTSRGQLFQTVMKSHLQLIK